jgi:hypothetical protein
MDISEKTPFLYRFSELQFTVHTGAPAQDPVFSEKRLIQECTGSSCFTANAAQQYIFRFFWVTTPNLAR